MAQPQIKGATGTVDGSGSLTTYSVPGTALATPYAVSVTADGTGASGAFLPCLTFRTITGAIIARCPAPEVAAGASSEVSWFPHVGGSSASAGATSETAYVWGLHGSPVTVPTGGTGVRVPWNHFQTTDSTIFGTDTNPSTSPPYHNTAGDPYLYFLQSGAYYCSGEIGMTGGAYAQVALLDNNGNQYDYCHESVRITVQLRNSSISLGVVYNSLTKDSTDTVQ